MIVNFSSKYLSRKSNVLNFKLDLPTIELNDQGYEEGN